MPMDQIIDQGHAPPIGELPRGETSIGRHGSGCGRETRLARLPLLGCSVAVALLPIQPVGRDGEAVAPTAEHSTPAPCAIPDPQQRRGLACLVGRTCHGRMGRPARWFLETAPVCAFSAKAKGWVPQTTNCRSWSDGVWYVPCASVESRLAMGYKLSELFGMSDEQLIVEHDRMAESTQDWVVTLRAEYARRKDRDLQKRMVGYTRIMVWCTVAIVVFTFVMLCLTLLQTFRR